MKNTLLTVTCLASSCLFSISSQAKLDVKMTGGIAYMAEIFNQDTETDFRGYDIENLSAYTELRWVVKGKMDNGTVYGLHYDLRPGASGGNGSTDEAYIFIENKTWGELRFGNDDSAADSNRIFIGDEAAGVGGFDGYGLENIMVGTDTDGDGKADRGRDGKNELEYLTDYMIAGTGVNTTGDATKIIYYTPKLWGGFQAGISYAPAADNESYDRRDREGDFDNQVAGSLHYEKQFNDWLFGVSADATWARWAGKSTHNSGTGYSYTHNKEGNFFGWETEAKIGYKGLTLVAGFGEDNVYGQYYGTEVAYTYGPHSMSIGWVGNARNGKRANLSPLKKDQKERLNTISVGLTERLAQGLSLLVDYNHFQFVSDRYAVNTGNTFIIGTNLQF